MLHLLIHAQFGYLLHPSIEMPTVEKGGEPLRIADVGTGTGYTDHLVGSHLRDVLILLADVCLPASGSANLPASYQMLVLMASTYQMSSIRLRNGTGPT